MTQMNRQALRTVNAFITEAEGFVRKTFRQLHEILDTVDFEHPEIRKALVRRSDLDINLRHMLESVDDHVMDIESVLRSMKLYLKILPEVMEGEADERRCEDDEC